MRLSLEDLRCKPRVPLVSRLSVANAAVIPGTRLRFIGQVGRGLAEVLSDQGVRHGIRLGLAGVLGLYLALLMRLEHPLWALFTVIVLMQGQYVGAIAPRAIARVVGTVLGGAIGTLLLGNWEQNPVLFLTTYFLLILVCMYLYGGSIFPYAFFLSANALTSVCGNGLNEPANAWSVGLARVLEILVGAIAVGIVSNLVFPRFARKEFRTLARQTLQTAAELITLHEQHLFVGQDKHLPARHLANQFREQTAQLSQLLALGAKESARFHVRQPTYERAIISMNRLLQTMFDLFETQPTRPRYLAEIGEQLAPVYRTLETILREASTSSSFTAEHAGELTPNMEALEARFVWLHAHRVAAGYSLEEVLELASEYQALHDLAQEVKLTGELLVSLPMPGDPPARDQQRLFRPGVDLSRLRDALRPAFASTAAIFLCNWIHPPGETSIPLLTFVLSATSKSTITGRGNRGVIQQSVWIALGGLIYLFAMFLLTPLLANYAVMNTLLFVALFLFGLLTSGQRGLSLSQNAIQIFIVSAVGLNAQRPVPVATVIDSYLGLIVPLFFVAWVLRMFWPILPEVQLRNLLTEFFTTCTQLIKAGPGIGETPAAPRLNLIPLEAIKWIHGLRSAVCPAEEVQKLLDLSVTLRELALHVTGRAKLHAPSLPANLATLLDPSVAQLRKELEAASKRCGRVFRERRRTTEASNLAEARRQFLDAVSAIRGQGLVQQLAPVQLLEFYALVRHAELMIRRLIRAEAQLNHLELERYWGDYAL